MNNKNQSVLLSLRRIRRKAFCTEAVIYLGGDVVALIDIVLGPVGYLIKVADLQIGLLS